MRLFVHNAFSELCIFEGFVCSVHVYSFCITVGGRFVGGTAAELARHMEDSQYQIMAWGRRFVRPPPNPNPPTPDTQTPIPHFSAGGWRFVRQQRHAPGTPPHPPRRLGRAKVSAPTLLTAETLTPNPYLLWPPRSILAKHPQTPNAKR